MPLAWRRSDDSSAMRRKRSIAAGVSQMVALSVTTGAAAGEPARVNKSVGVICVLDLSRKARQRLWGRCRRVALLRGQLGEAGDDDGVGVLGHVDRVGAVGVEDVLPRVHNRIAQRVRAGGIVDGAQQREAAPLAIDAVAARGE